MLIAFFILTFCTFTTSTNLKCIFNNGTYSVLPNIYRCEVEIDPNIDDAAKAQITSTSGTHTIGRTKDDVVGLHAIHKTFKQFPRGLETTFKNIKSVYIAYSKLKEVTQSDLIPLPNLENLDLYGNEIEVVEPGLFDFNLELLLISFGGNNILHVDSNVFDNLTKLTHLWFHSVPCIDSYGITKRDSERVIKNLKGKCKDPEFSKLEALDSDTKLENELKTSKFSGCSYFKVKLGKLRNSSLISTTTLEPTSSKAALTSEIPKVKDSCTDCCSIDNISQKLDNFTSHQAEIEGSLRKIKSLIDQHDSKLSDVQNSQSNLKSLQSSLTDAVKEFGAEIKDLKASQDQIQSSLGSINSTENDIKDLITSNIKANENEINDVKNGINDVKNGINDVKNGINDVKSGINHANNDLNILKDATNPITDLTSSQIKIQSSLNNLTASQNTFLTALEDHKSILKSTKLSQDEATSNLIDMKATVSDIESAVNNVKITQNEVKTSLGKMRIAQNEIGASIQKIENSDEKFLKIDDKLESFEDKMSEKFEVMKHELAKSRHKMSVSIDEKLNGIEKRLLKKFEEVFDEKLSKIIEQKLKNVL
ncbi:unnamed protein product [Chironomus riparius]|uniref:Uncharacterized protein n=1 Tax=Chironomus riparius TaxID=315576 RepID=A0A9P0J9P4_9DIPT|nr:unnamed protein product [Chironomus riparius]